MNKTVTETYTVIDDVNLRGHLFDKLSQYRKYLELRVKANDRLAKKEWKYWRYIIINEI